MGIKLEATSICIGICDSSQIHRFTNSDFAGSKYVTNYAFCSNDGNLYSTDTGCHEGVAYGQPFGEGDIITITFNPCHSTLQFTINEMKQPLIENIKRWMGLNYCVAVMMGHYAGNECTIDLISPFQRIADG